MYDASQKLQYLDMVMDESTRVCTPIPRSVTVVYCPSGYSCSCPLTGDLTSSACVCGCVVNGVSATAAT